MSFLTNEVFGFKPFISVSYSHQHQVVLSRHAQTSCRYASGTALTLDASPSSGGRQGPHASRAQRPGGGELAGARVAVLPLVHRRPEDAHEGAPEGEGQEFRPPIY
jgi:hypothetical protein